MYEYSPLQLSTLATPLSMNKHLQIREHIATFKALTGNSPAYFTKLFNRCSNETYTA